MDAPLHRPGITAVNCMIAPGVRLAILIDQTVSWPMIKNGDQPWTSLEDPVAAKVWFPNTSPLRVRLDRDAFVTVGNAQDNSLALVYSVIANRPDADSINALVVVRTGPPCLLGVTPDPEEALRLARDTNSPCIQPVWRR